jgi:hypothetical protein
MADAPSFDIPAHPERNYTATGGVEYEGTTVFDLEPDGEPASVGPDDEPGASTSEAEGGPIGELVAAVLADDRYVRGDWFDLPRPVYLVHDRDVSTSFRLVVLSGRIELHVLPSTDAEGLRAFHEGLRTESSADWSVDCRVERP